MLDKCQLFHFVSFLIEDDFGSASQADKVTRCICFEFGIPNHGVSNCVIYVHRPNAGYDYGPGGECSLGVCGRRTGGVNGPFIYHRCHGPPERKSALPN